MPAYLEGNPCMYEYLYLLIVSKSLALQAKNKTSLKDAFAKFGWNVIKVIWHMCLWRFKGRFLALYLSRPLGSSSVPFACRASRLNGVVFEWDCKNRGSVSQQVWHDKDPSCSKAI